jgi:mannosyltransferase
VSSEAAGRSQSRTTVVLLAALIILALALRVWRLGHWGLEGDEIFTLRDSINPPRASNPRPLLYFLNHYVVRPLMPLDELGLRLLPAFFGVLAIPAFYIVGRRLIGTRAALFGALLLAVNPIHVYQSQSARYWSLVFLLCTVYPFAIYFGFRERDWRPLVVGIVAGILAVLAHPVSALLLGGVAIALAMSYIRRDYLAQLWDRKGLRWGTLVTGIIVAAIAVRYIPILQTWIVTHDTARLPDHLLHLPRRPGIKQIALLLSYVDGLTVPLALTGAAGIYLLWQGRDRPLAILLLCMLGFPLGVLLLLSFRTAVSTSYFLPTVPVFFLGAGFLLDRLAGLRELRPSWLLPGLMAAFIIAGGAPTLISQYRDGRRHDFRGAALWLEGRLKPGDIVFSEQSGTMNHYLGGRAVHRLYADPAPLTESLKELGPGKVLWIVTPVSAQGGFRTNPGLGSLNGWIYDNCRLRRTIGVARLDFRQKELQVYRCP